MALLYTSTWYKFCRRMKFNHNGKDHKEKEWPQCFWDFLLLNEDIYRAAEALAFQAAAKRDHYTISGIWEVIRWFTEIVEDSPDETFKLNNDWSPYVGRLIMWDNPKEIPQDFFARRILTKRDRPQPIRKDKDL